MYKLSLVLLLEHCFLFIYFLSRMYASTHTLVQKFSSTMKKKKKEIVGKSLLQ